MTFTFLQHGRAARVSPSDSRLRKGKDVRVGSLQISADGMSLPRCAEEVDAGGNGGILSSENEGAICVECALYGCVFRLHNGPSCEERLGIELQLICRAIE